MEMVLVGLAGCTAMDVLSIMAKKRQPLTNLQVKVNADRAESHPRVFTNIHIEYIAHGAGVEEQALARAIELSEGKYCSVQGMLGETAEITSSYSLVDAPNPTTPGAIPAQA
jgi:putative redox protein